MQAKKRYILVFLSCAFLALCYFGGHRLKTALPWSSKAARHRAPLESYLDSEDVMERRMWTSPRDIREELRCTTAKEHCRMETCFDFSKCASGFRVYVYPVDESASPALSSTYRKILNVVTESR